MASNGHITRTLIYCRICNPVTDRSLGMNATGGLSEIALYLTVAKV